LLTRQPLHLGRQPEQHPEGVLGDLFTSEMRFGGQVRTVLEHLHGLRGAGEKTLTITRQADHLAKLWSDTHSPLQTLAGINDLADLGLTNFSPGQLGAGGRRKPGGGVWHLFTDAEIFGWQRPEPRRHSRPKQSTPEAPFADLQVGDYVVHIEHGIGRFEGLIKQVFKGEERELLKLEYAGNDVLFVPIHQADRVTRYIAPGDAGPTLNRLGTQEWVKIRQKATEAAEKFAEELLKLYAAREVATGHAFGPDTPWQHELEAAFPYVETDDQLSAIRAVKADMESPQPMDRLVCGDVGYGKTEVAMRAAFKAVMDKKQVALLAPTTILANQHYHNFRERMAHFGVNVEMLSRFRNEKQQDQILAALAAGQIDIIIGTHRLLGSDVQFKDLGLVIVDEEQRFGMTHKEQLKLFRNELDVLTLTATPIPRTLYTTIVGIRDISTISTAPDERLPVATHVGVYNGALVRQAIVRELERGGQVFFVHNRVQTIDSIAGHLREMLPQAQIAVGHGQMSEQQLEKVMLQFALGEADILLATSIIENGLDIPNANTIIIDRADWFGLAALYQLRGRVGRSARQAYAYFFHPPYSKITDEARQRLEILSQENQLGVGLSIAMRDLEMRGAGDLLGKRQSGHVAAVGFHLYTQLLAQAVRRLRPKHTSSVGPAPIQPALIIDLPIPAYIPREYIPDAALRIQLYRRLADLHELGAVDDMQAELEDRFGKLPRAIEGLLYQLKVKVLAAQAQATAILQDTERIGIKLPYLALIDRHDLQKLLGEAVKVSREAIWLPRSPQESQWQPLLLGVLEKLHVAPYWVKEREPSELSS
jgi:transcription-repair coupling factor (superfamily II helicase)